MGPREAHEKMIEETRLMMQLKDGAKETFVRNDGERMVVIPRAKFLDLLEDAEFLSCLRAAGVDNWQGYDDACQMYNEED